ncbi:MAG TPA: mechanosensitive ion channel domain-containing protein [Pseudomonadales bacterium]|nr:mechanosensitive ion channel domain-containing protein [Pseudomonadales bacterium]
MNNTNGASTNALPQLVGPLGQFWSGSSHLVHILIIVVIAIAVHALVRFVRYFSEVLITKSHEKKNALGFVTEQPKFVTLSRLVISVAVFLIYAVAIYVILSLEFPNDNTFKTYLTSAAVIGLALSFGLQGLVQDIVTGITIILSDTIDVGDTVDLMNGVIGRVERIGLRFVKVINVYNQEIYVPNRNIANISRFPHGGIHAFVDIQIPVKVDQSAVVQTIQTVAKGVQSQFSAIIFDEPAFSKVETTPGNWNYMRVRFRIWPGQNNIIENVFVQQTTAAMKTFDPNYATWQIVTTYRAMNF